MLTAAILLASSIVVLAPAVDDAARSGVITYCASDDPLREIRLKDAASGVHDPRFRIPVNSTIADIAVDPTRSRIYAADRDRGAVLVINETSLAVEANIATRSIPSALTIDPSGSHLYVGHAGNRSILVIDLNSLSIQRVLDVPFLVFGLAAPTDDTLVATTHDDQWSGGFPYVLNATTGEQLQRISDDLGSLVYQDAMPVLSPDRQRLFLIDTLVAPVGILSFARSPGQLSWAFVAKVSSSASAQLGAHVTDAAVSPDGRYLYVATKTTPALKVATGSLSVVGRFGTVNESTSVTVSPSGDTIAVSSMTTGAILYSSSGTELGRKSFEAPPSKLRSTVDGLKLVASVGLLSQDIEVVWSTTLGRTGPGPYTNNSTPRLSLQAALFAELSFFQFNVTFSGTRIAAAYDPSERELIAQVPFPLLPGVRYGIYAQVTWPGSGIAISWTIALHTIPPVLGIEVIPPRVSDPVITVRGTVSDDLPLTLSIGGSEVPYWAIGPDGDFSREVNLTQGYNTITLIAQDAAGNQAVRSLTIEFVPVLQRFTSLEKHFAITVPYKWEALGPVLSGGTPVDVYMFGPDGDANLIVYSEHRETNGTFGEALATLEEDLADLSSEADFRVLEGPQSAIVDEHAAASSMVQWRTNSSGLIAQVITVVLGPEHALFWAVIATMYASSVPVVAPIANSTTGTFEILLPVPNPRVAPLPNLLVTAALGLAVALPFMALLLILASRRARQTGPKHKPVRRGRRVE